ncbi:MAG: EAL domain-containing protein [Burkholderiales bacterium]|nr:EAL domain-containing protein [Burkholderiales bacterium]
MRRMTHDDPRRLRAVGWAAVLAAAASGALAHAAWAAAAAPVWAGAGAMALLAVLLVEADWRRRTDPAARERPGAVAGAGDAVSTLPSGHEPADDARRAKARGPVLDPTSPATGGRPAASAAHNMPRADAPAADRAPMAAGITVGGLPAAAASMLAQSTTSAARPAPAGAAPAENDAAVPAPLADALRRALDARELHLVYQPMIDLRTRRVHAVEALLRWPRAVQSLMPTVEIVEVAERAGFGQVLGRFVLESACQQLARWQQVLGDAAPQRLSVNLTRSQCLDPALRSWLDDALAAHALQPRALQIELVAAALAGDEALQRALRPLRAAGVAVALDRFGEGAASLARLRELPVDLVKVDRGIVQRIQGGGPPRMVMESTLRVAASLGLPVVAEGVETRAQLELLRELGCPLAQGHALCAPVDAFALTRRLRSGDCVPRALVGGCRSAPPLSA